MALVEDIQFPVDRAGFGIDAGNAVFVVAEDQLGRPPFGLKHTWRGVGGLALARDLPARLAGVAIERDDRAFSFVLVRHDDQAVVDDQRDAEPVARLKRPEFALPFLLAGVVERDDLIILWRGEWHIDMALICRRSAGRPTVVFMLAVIGDGVLPGPERSAVFAIQADNQPLSTLHITVGDEEPIAPEDGRGVPFAGELDFPEAVLLGPRDIGGADAGAVGTTEAGPVLREGGASKTTNTDGCEHYVARCHMTCSKAMIERS